MSITYKCDHCGAWQEARDGQAGSSVKCPDCKNRNLIPRATPDAQLFDHQLDAVPASNPGPTRSQAPTRMSWGSEPAPRAERSEPADVTSASSAQSSVKGWSGWGVLGFIAIVAIKLLIRMPANRMQPAARPAPFAIPVQKPGGQPVVGARPKLIVAPPLDAPFVVPALTDLPPGREIEPGIMVHELRLGQPGGPSDRNPPEPRISQPGGSTRLWIYLPKSDGKAIKPGSLPCVLMPTGSGSFIQGHPLDNKLRDQHLAFARAGFAVVAFDVDGYGQTVPTSDGKRKLNIFSNLIYFVLARAGLANMHVALEYASKKLPLIDTERIAMAGLQSGGNLSLLATSLEPRIKACAVYAPMLDLGRSLPLVEQQSVRTLAGNDVLKKFSPITYKDRLNSPLLLLTPQGDEDSVDEAKQVVASLKQRHQQVQLELLKDSEDELNIVKTIIPQMVDWTKKAMDQPKRP